MSTTTNWRKGKEKSTIDYQKLDSFIELALSKFEYKEPLSSLYTATGSHSYYIINNNSLTPDLVIFNEIFNKNVCFYDFKGGSYNPFPRKKFNIEQKKRKNFDKSNLQQDDLNSHGSFEEDPQWVDVEIGELDKVDLQFQSLPFPNPNSDQQTPTKLERYGKCDKYDKFDKFTREKNKENRDDNSINLSNLEDRNDNGVNKSIHYDGEKDNEYAGDFNMGIFCDQNESSIINPENTSHDYGLNTNTNSNENNKTDGFLESMSQIRNTLMDPNLDHKINNNRGISAFQANKNNDNESFNDKPVEFLNENSESKSRKSSFNQASLMNNFDLNLICGDKRPSKDLSINNTSNLDFDSKETKSRKLSEAKNRDTESKLLNQVNQEDNSKNIKKDSIEIKDIKDSVEMKENKEGKEVKENADKEEDNNNKSNSNSGVKNYYVNNNFTNIQINMTPNLMGNQMNFPFHLLNYNMPFNPYMRPGYNLNMNNMTGMQVNNEQQQSNLSNLNNINSNINSVQVNQEKTKLTANEASDNQAEENLSKNISTNSTTNINSNTNPNIPIPTKDNKFNNNMLNNNFMFMQNMQYNNQMQAYMNLMQQGQNKDVQTTQNQISNFDSQFIENPSAVIVKNMYLKNWFVLTEKDKLINFSSIELLDFLEMYYKAEKKYEILHINDYQSDMYFNPVTLLEYLREIVPSFKFKMPNPSTMMFHQMSGMFKPNQTIYNKSSTIGNTNSVTNNNTGNSNSNTSNLHKGSVDNEDKGYKNAYNSGNYNSNSNYDYKSNNYQKQYTVNNITIEEDKRKKFKVYPSSQAYKNKK